MRISSIAMTAACALCGQVAYTAVALNPNLIFCHFSYLIIKTLSVIAVAGYQSEMNHLVTTEEELVM